MTSGGGSARLLPTYTVSPLEGFSAVANEIGAEITYGIGATSHKYLPLLDRYITLEDGQPGALVEFWNESPEESWLKADTDFHKQAKAAVWSTTTKGSDCFLMDGIVTMFHFTQFVMLTVIFQDEEKVNEICWIRVSQVRREK